LYPDFREKKKEAKTRQDLNLYPVNNRTISVGFERMGARVFIEIQNLFLSA
jgi:hypothetical protein